VDFFIADTHFGHENIVRYCGRPFKDAAEMDATIVGNWNRVVSKEDTVYHLGDFALAHKERVAEYFNALNGRIVLVMGNHDRQRTVTFWKKLGFAEAHKEPLPYGWFYLLSHEPAVTGLTNIHGHTHGNDHRGESSGICVSCEAIGYTPRTFKELMEVTTWK